LLPRIEQDTIDQEDVKFREYLMANEYDTSMMGLEGVSTTGGESNDGVPTEKTYGKEA
jgi:hypothetical protein